MDKSRIFHTNRTIGFFIEHAKRESPFFMKSKHFHSQYEIYYLLAGDRNYFAQGKVYNIKKGDLILINSNVLHKSVDGISSFHERLLIEFDMSFFESFLINYNVLELFNIFNNDSIVVHLDEPIKKQFENCFFKIIQESKGNSIENSIALKVYFLELLIIISKLDYKTNISEFNNPSPLHKKISEIVAYINNNYMNDIGLDFISGRFFISSAHLSRAFKKVTGFTFIQYLNSLRIKEAQKLLARTPLSISEISRKVGYQNCTHFGRMFKSITSFSPREYRKLF